MFIYVYIFFFFSFSLCHGCVVIILFLFFFSSLARLLSTEICGSVLTQRINFIWKFVVAWHTLIHSHTWFSLAWFLTFIQHSSRFPSTNKKRELFLALLAPIFYYGRWLPWVLFSFFVPSHHSSRQNRIETESNICIRNAETISNKFFFIRTISKCMGFHFVFRLWR